MGDEMGWAMEDGWLVLHSARCRHARRFNFQVVVGPRTSRAKPGLTKYRSLDHSYTLPPNSRTSVRHRNTYTSSFSRRNGKLAFQRAAYGSHQPRTLVSLRRHRAVCLQGGPLSRHHRGHWVDCGHWNQNPSRLTKHAERQRRLTDRPGECAIEIAPSDHDINGWIC